MMKLFRNMDARVFGLALLVALFSMSTSWAQQAQVKVQIPRHAVATSAAVDTLTATQMAQRQTQFDGLGRPMKSTVFSANTAAIPEDIVQLFQYDEHGRRLRNYLPYIDIDSISTNDFADQAKFWSDPDGMVERVATDTQPYSEAAYEASLRPREMKFAAVGQAWDINGSHVVSRKTFLHDPLQIHVTPVYRWSFTFQAQEDVHYGAGELSISRSANEEGITVDRYTNTLGQTVLLRKHLNQGGVKYLETYFLYDEYARLRYVIPPKATAILLGQIESQGFTSVSVTNPLASDQLFSYQYDGLGRVIEKKVPDAGPVYMVYDARDRVVLAQDANLRSRQLWYYTRYDARNRVQDMGTYDNPNLGSRQLAQDYIDQQPLPGNALSSSITLPPYGGQSIIQAGAEINVENGADLNPAVEGHSILLEISEAFPEAEYSRVLTRYHYDTYDWNSDGTDDYTFFTEPQLPSNTPTADVPSPFLRTRGLVTGVEHRILGTDDFTASVVFYDSYLRPIQSQSSNHRNFQNGLTDISTIVYHFDGRTRSSVSRQVMSSSESLVVVNEYEYYDAGALKEIYQTNIHNAVTGARQLVAEYEYNRIGQLVEKNLHGDGNGAFLQSVDYAYNIRGWLTHLNTATLGTQGEGDVDSAADLFGMELHYEVMHSATTGLNHFQGRHDGKIAATTWQVAGDNQQGSSHKAYAYGYDNVGRLAQARYQATSGLSRDTWTQELDAFSVTNLSYDANGNILSLTRKTQALRGSTVTVMDQLQYTYSGNLLQSVADAGDGSLGFIDGAQAAEEFFYDAAGNLVADHNKGVDTLLYNVLNKPTWVQTDEGKSYRYTYSASGVRLAKEVLDTTGFLYKRLDYIGGVTYENDTLSYFGAVEGRVVNTGVGLQYQYVLTDAQGRARVTFAEGSNGAAEIIQDDHYYPFGLQMGGINGPSPGTPTNVQLLPGAEIQDEILKSPYQSFPLREYDPTLGRFTSVDPFAEYAPSWTPWRFGFDDPVNYVDPSGGFEAPTGEELADLARNADEGTIITIHSDMFGGWYDVVQTISADGNVSYGASPSSSIFRHFLAEHNLRIATPRFQSSVSKNDHKQFLDVIARQFSEWITNTFLSNRPSDIGPKPGPEYWWTGSTWHKYGPAPAEREVAARSFSPGNKQKEEENSQSIAEEEGIIPTNEGMQQNPLMRHSEDAVTWSEWMEANGGLTRDQIVNQRTDRSLGLGSQPGGPELRYVIDPLNPNAIIDMRHMLIVGEYGPFVGTPLEGLQSILGQASGMDPQDFYSNQLGYRFKRYFEGKGLTGWLSRMISSQSYTERLNSFITNPNFRGSKIFIDR